MKQDPFTSGGKNRMEEIIEEKKEEKKEEIKEEKKFSDDPIIRYIQKRLWRRNQNWLMAICGATGSGKSFSALRIASEIDPNFSVEHVIFFPKDLMTLLGQPLPKGTAIVYDEAGVSYSAREWQTLSNRLINYVMQTFRERNLALIMTVPDSSFLDVQIRKLFHMIALTQKIHRTIDEVELKPFFITNYPLAGKIYTTYPIMYGNKITRWYIKKPNAKLVHAYREKKETFFEWLRQRTERELPAPEMREKIKEYILQNMKNKEIAEKTGMSIVNVGKIRIKIMDELMRETSPYNKTQ